MRSLIILYFINLFLPMFKNQKNIILISIFIAFLTLSGAVFGLSKFGSHQSPNSVPFPNSSSQSLVQSNSYSNVKPLIADAEHDVFVLEECDLAVRFSKKTLNIEKIGRKAGGIFNFKLNYNNIPVFGSCGGGFEAEDVSEDMENTALFKTLKNDSYVFDETKVKAYLKEYKFTKNSFKQYLAVQINDNSVNFRDFTIRKIEGQIYTSTSFISLEKKIANFQIQIQPNSLAPSVPSVKL